MAFWKYGLVVGALSLSLLTARAQVPEITNAPGTPPPAPAVNPLPSTNLPPGAPPPPGSQPDTSQEPPPGSDAPAYVAFGVANGQKGDLDAAVAAFAQAIKIDPKYSPAYYNQGYAYLLQNKRDDAIADFNQVISLSPNFRDAYYQRGSLYGERGDFDSASRDFMTVMKIDPKYAPAHYNLGHVYYFRGNLAAAAQEMDAAVRLNPNGPLPYYIRGLVRQAQGQRLEALGDFQKSFGLGFSNAAFWVWILQNQSKQPDAAKQELITARSKGNIFKPGEWPTPVADFLLGRITEQQMIAQAKADNAQDTIDQTCQAYFYAGKAKQIAGDQAGARAEYAKAIATGSTSSEEFLEAQRILSSRGP